MDNSIFLNQCWNAYSLQPDLKSLTPKELESSKRAFYKGASVVASLLNTESPVSFDERAIFMKSIMNEIREHQASYIEEKDH